MPTDFIILSWTKTVDTPLGFRLFFKNKRDAPISQSFFLKTSETTLWFRLFLSKTGENPLWFHPFSVKTGEHPLWFWVFSAYTCGLPAVVSWPKRSASTHCLMLHRHEKRSIHPCGWIDLLKFYCLKFRAVGQQQRVLYQLHWSRTSWSSWWNEQPSL